MDSGVPVWTIILGIIGLMVNVIIGLIAWTINTKLGDLRDAISSLTKADQDLWEDLLKLERAHSERMSLLERDLHSHKLDAAKAYTPLEQHNRTTEALFEKIDKMQGAIIEQVHELCRSVNLRIDSVEGRADRGAYCSHTSRGGMNGHSD